RGDPSSGRRRGDPRRGAPGGPGRAHGRAPEDPSRSARARGTAPRGPRWDGWRTSAASVVPPLMSTAGLQLRDLVGARVEPVAVPGPAFAECSARLRTKLGLEPILDVVRQIV